MSGRGCSRRGAQQSSQRDELLHLRAQVQTLSKEDRDSTTCRFSEGSLCLSQPPLECVTEIYCTLRLQHNTETCNGTVVLSMCTVGEFRQTPSSKREFQRPTLPAVTCSLVIPPLLPCHVYSESSQKANSLLMNSTNNNYWACFCVVLCLAHYIVFKLSCAQFSFTLHTLRGAHVAVHRQDQ